MSFDREKFKTLVHYICYRCEDPTRLGAVKLNKILWFSEVAHYVKFGRPITGETYMKLEHGPVPSHMPEVLRALQDEKALVVRRPELQYETTLYFASEGPAISGFTPEEISMVERMLEEICDNHTATSISRLSHDEIWDMAEIGEEIPYEAMLVAKLGQVTEADLRWAAKEVAGAA